LTDDLIAIHPIVDAGCDIQLTSEGGVMNKGVGGDSIPIVRNGRKWLVDLEDLKSVKIKQNSLSCYTISIANQVMHLHEHMGHPSSESMCKAITSGASQNAKVTVDQIRRVMEQSPCLPCILAKKNKPRIQSSHSSNPLNLQVGELISGDIIGKIQPPTRDDDVSFFLFVDKKTGYVRAYTAKTKEGFVTALDDVIKHFRNYEHQVKFFRSDSEQIIKWGPVRQLLQEEGIQHECSLPYAHYQNLVERYVQTICKATSTILHGQSLLKASLWNYALFYVVDCQNTTPKYQNWRKPPNQFVTGSKYLDLQREHLFSFGEIVIVCKTEKTWKFDLKNDIAIYIGLPKGTVNGGTV
jgi:hypothetical protein